MNNVEAKALLNTLAKKLKYTKPDTHETTLDDVAAEGLVDTLVTRCYDEKFCGTLGDTEDEPMVETVAATEAPEEGATLDDALGNVLANPLLNTVADTIQAVMPETLIGGLGDVEGDSLVDTIADT